jgi:hypothetical protein
VELLTAQMCGPFIFFTFRWRYKEQSKKEKSFLLIHFTVKHHQRKVNSKQKTVFLTVFCVKSILLLNFFVRLCSLAPFAKLFKLNLFSDELFVLA